MGIGDIVRKIAVARFSRTLGTLVAAGVPILQAIEITGQTAGNVVIEKAMDEVRPASRRARRSPSRSREARSFPTMVVQMLAVGEETGALDTMLSKVADFYEDEVDAVGQVADLDPRADHDDRRRRHRRHGRHLDVPADLQHDEHREDRRLAGVLVTNEQLVAHYAATRSAATLDRIVRATRSCCTTS